MKDLMELAGIFVVLVLACSFVDDLFRKRLPWAWRHRTGACGGKCEACD